MGYCVVMFAQAELSLLNSFSTHPLSVSSQCSFVMAPNSIWLLNFDPIVTRSIVTGILTVGCNHSRFCRRIGTIFLIVFSTCRVSLLTVLGLWTMMVLYLLVHGQRLEARIEATVRAFNRQLVRVTIMCRLYPRNVNYQSSKGNIWR